MSKLAFLAAACLLATTMSCSGPGQSAPCPVCPKTRLTSRLRSGTVTFAANGAAPETRVLSPGDSAASCRAGAFVFVTPPDSPAPWLLSNVQLSCSLSDGSFDITGAIPDRRFLDVGSYPFALPTTFLDITSLHVICGGAASTGLATLEVTRAEGKGAPYPTAATPDYARDFTVHIETSRPSVQQGDCFEPAISVTADLQFTETAADAVSSPEELCGCG